MRNFFLFIVVLLLIASLISGCSDDKKRYYAPQGQSAPAQGQQQGYPVGGGCGIAAPPSASIIEVSAFGA